MKSFQILALMGAVFGFAHAQQSYSSGALGSYGSSSVSTTPRPLPPAQVHYVNIGEDLTGDYKFGYDTGKNDGGQSFREESRLPDGTVKGAYGYIDAEGKQRIVKYSAGIEGFKVESDEAAPGQGAPAAPQQAAPRTYSPRPQPVQAAPQPQYQPQYQPQAQPQPQPQLQKAQAPAQYDSGLYDASRYETGRYNPVSASAPARYAPAQPQPQPIPVQAAPQPAPATYTPRTPSPLPNYSAALQAQLAAVQASGAAPQQAPQYRPQPQSVPSYSATLGQRQPTLAQARPAHLASIPRSSSPSLSAYGSTFASSSVADQESTTWGPPVINKELLSYNIGIGK